MEIYDDFYTDYLANNDGCKCGCCNKNSKQPLCTKFYNDEHIYNYGEEYQDEYDWEIFCTYVQMSTKTLEKHKDKIMWEKVSMFQNLSEDFMKKFKEEIRCKDIARYQKFSPLFAVEFNMFSFIDEIELNEKLNDFDKQSIINTLQIVEKITI